MPFEPALLEPVKSGFDESLLEKVSEPEDPEKAEKIAALKRGIEHQGDVAAAETAKATAFDVAAKALDIPGALAALGRLPWTIAGQQPPRIDPVKLREAVESITPQPKVEPRLEVPKSVQEFAEGAVPKLYEQAAGMVTPENALLAVLAKRFPAPVGGYFAGESLANIPPATKQLLEAKTPREAGAAAAELVPSVAVPALIARAGAKPTERIQDARQIETPAEVHGDVRPLETPAETLPAEESRKGVQPSPKEEAGVPTDEAILKEAESKTGQTAQKIAEDIDQMPLDEFVKWTKQRGTDSDSPTGVFREIGETAPNQEFVDWLKAKAEEWQQKVRDVRDKIEKEPSREKQIQIVGDEKQPTETKAQLFREAYERATGTGSQVDPGYEPPFPIKPEVAKPAAPIQSTASGTTKGGVSPEAIQESREGAPSVTGGVTETKPSLAPALGITVPGAELVQKASAALKSFRNKLVNSWATRGNKADIARAKDAADNQARIYANQSGRSVRLEAQRLFGDNANRALKAVGAVIEAGGDRNKLQQFITQSTGKHLEARNAARFASIFWDRLQPLADKIKSIHDQQLADENANGITTTFRENYIKHAFDVDKLPNRGDEFFGGTGIGSRSGFKAERKFDTIYDAIEAGYGKAIKSLDAAKLVESRLASGQQLINDRQWVNSFRSVADPTTGKPLLDNVTFDKNHFPHAPAGYNVATILPGQFIAVHNGYGGIFDAVTGASKIAQAEVAGLPVGKGALATAAGIKHGLLLFDTFHASRIMQKQFFLTGKVGYRKGVSLLEYTDADLSEAVRQGEITQDMADYARANRPTAELLLKEGLNVGRIQEALRSELIRNLPVVGTFNKWVFDKVTRGAMMESALIEFDRTKANNPTMTDQQAAAQVAKNINVTFGNIGRQGIFKSRTMQDLSRLVALAPQWVESMARSEIGGFKDLGKVPIDAAMGKGLQVGTLGKTMATGLLAYVVGTQLLNLATRGKPTWENEEEGHKLDAWIPDVTGNTKGFFLNPLSVVAELTHDAYRYAFKKDNAFDIGKQIAENKASPIARSVGVLWSGKNFQGEKIQSSWNRAKEAAITLAPTPIPLSGVASARPGQTQRQLTAALGVKTEPAETDRQRIQKMANRFVEEKGLKKKGYEFVPTDDPSYVKLRDAIRNGDEKGATKLIGQLRQGRSDAQILKAMQAGSTRPLTGSKRAETEFISTLSDKEAALYESSREDQKQQYQRFLEIWSVRP